MHETMIRLYEAAKKLKHREGQSDVAHLLNMSPQRLNNWEARGMSRQGMLDAEKKIGCSATWIETGRGQMVPKLGVSEPAAEYGVMGGQAQAPHPFLTDDEERLVRLFRQLPPMQREFFLGTVEFLEKLLPSLDSKRKLASAKIKSSGSAAGKMPGEFEITSNGNDTQEKARESGQKGEQ